MRGARRDPVTVDDLNVMDSLTAPTPNGAEGRRCRRHVWGPRTGTGRMTALSVDQGWEPGVCVVCGKPKEESAVRRGRTSLRAGKDAERAIAKAYGGRRTGQFGGPDDVVVGDLFVVQSKVRGAFPEWMWAELAKLPRAGGRIPTLIVSDRPGPGHPVRRLVMRMMADDLALHGETK